MQSVEKWSMTIHRLFSKDPNDEEENVTQNIYVFRFILFCIIVYSFEMLLNSVLQEGMLQDVCLQLYMF